MKLLRSHRAWQEWVRSVFGASEESSLDMPKSYPCYAYTVVDSFKDCTQTPLYLSRRDIEAMAIELVASEIQK